ncbi:hypothetical protein, partial [Paraburkholderia heleia]|uniref:hypothetical protein n=1 Tax=Paraburkholderia heleia TaxID=634127 RepID=UPI0031DE1FCB
HDPQEAAASLRPRSCRVVHFCRSDNSRRLKPTTDKTLYSGRTNEFADFNHKSRLLFFTNSVASLRSATRFAITSDERSAPVVTSIRHCFVIHHRHVARHWLLPTTGT